MKEEILEVAGGKCWKNIGMKILSVTGELLDDTLHSIYNVILVTFIFKEEKSIFKFPETWILPTSVLFTIGAYAVLAIVFYNKDG